MHTALYTAGGSGIDELVVDRLLTTFDDSPYQQMPDSIGGW